MKKFDEVAIPNAHYDPQTQKLHVDGYGIIDTTGNSACRFTDFIGYRSSNGHCALMRWQIEACLWNEYLQEWTGWEVEYIGDRRCRNAGPYPLKHGHERKS